MEAITLRTPEEELEEIEHREYLRKALAAFFDPDQGGLDDTEKNMLRYLTERMASGDELAHVDYTAMTNALGLRNRFQTSRAFKALIEKLAGRHGVHRRDLGSRVTTEDALVSRWASRRRP